MGALIFYIAIYFLGYYAAYLLNLLSGRTLIRNRRIAGLGAVFMVSMLHGYKIISSSPPDGHDEGMTYALGLYVILPVAIIVSAVMFLTWQERDDHDRS
ncbi:MAG: hypothetical protein NTW90_08765 [Nitrosospira sp.]|nr:hypothetical protein [Nitrosospira sp.]